MKQTTLALALAAPWCPLRLISRLRWLNLCCTVCTATCGNGSSSTEFCRQHLTEKCNEFWMSQWDEMTILQQSNVRRPQARALPPQCRSGYSITHSHCLTLPPRRQPPSPNLIHADSYSYITYSHTLSIVIITRVTCHSHVMSHESYILYIYHMNHISESWIMNHKPHLSLLSLSYIMTNHWSYFMFNFQSESESCLLLACFEDLDLGPTSRRSNLALASSSYP